MWILLRFATLIAVYCARLLWRGHSGASQRFGDLEIAVHHSKNKRGEITRLWFGLPYAQPVLFRLSREGALDRWFKAVGLASEQQSGDADFDALVYVASDHYGFGRLLKASRDARAAIWALLVDNDARSIFSDGRFVWVESGVSQYAPGEPERDALRRLVAALQTIPARSAERSDGFALKVLLVEAAAWSIASYGVLGALELIFTTGTRFPEKARLIWLGLLLAAALFVAIFALIAAVLRGSSRGHRIVIESFIVLLLGLPLTGVQAVADLDTALDRAEPSQVAALVERKVERRQRRGQRTRYLELQWPSGEASAPIERITVGALTYNRAREGAPITIAVHPGALGIRWIEIEPERD